MRPYFENISDLIPFDVDSLIDDVNALSLDFDIQEKNTLRLKKYNSSILNQNFVMWLKNNFDVEIESIVIFHWLTDNNPNLAHIDSNEEGVISPGTALNWTITKTPSSVSWFETDLKKHNINCGHEGSNGLINWNVSNATPCTVVSVNYKDRVAEWSDRGPALIDTSLLHMVYAPDYPRISVSLNFGNFNKFDDLIEKVDKIRLFNLQSK